MKLRNPRRIIGALWLVAPLSLVVIGAARQSNPKITAPAKPISEASASKAPAVIPLPIASLGTPPASVPTDATYQSADLVVSYSSNWQGLLEPCGCVSGQYGGVARLATFLQQQSASNPNQLPVFAGDFTNTTSDEERLKAGVFYSTLEKIGYQAATLGEYDFAHGLPFVLDQIKKHPSLIISANLRDAKTGKLIAKPYVLRSYPARPGDSSGRKSIRVAVTGFLGLREAAQFPDLLGKDADQIKTEDPTKVLPNLVAKLRAEADVVVVLAHADEQEALDVARDSTGIDLLVVGHAAGLYYDVPPVIRKTTMLANGDRGRYAAQAALTFASDGSIKVATRQLPLSEEYPDHAEIAKLRDSYKAKLAAMRGGTITADQVSPTALFFPVSGGNAYVGSDECQTCHQSAYKVWMKSLHMRALITLQTTKGGINRDRPECVRCHTVGFGQPTGFDLKKMNLKLAGVGCESCHGPGKLHIEAAKAGGAKPGSIFRGFNGGDAELCFRCHDEPNSPRFNYAQYVELIRHWGDGFEKKTASGG